MKKRRKLRRKPQQTLEAARPATENPRYKAQTRKALRTHYAAKYRLR